MGCMWLLESSYIYKPLGFVKVREEREDFFSENGDIKMFN